MARWALAGAFRYRAPAVALVVRAELALAAAVEVAIEAVAEEHQSQADQQCCSEGRYG